MAYLAQGSKWKRETASIALLHMSVELAPSTLTSLRTRLPFQVDNTKSRSKIGFRAEKAILTYF